MTNLTFDTYAQVKQLVQTGVPEAQAEAIINAVAGATSLPDISQLATKTDLAVLQQATKTDLAVLQQTTKTDLAVLESKIVLVEANLKGDIRGLKGELIWWIVGCFGLNACISLGAVLPQLLAHLPK